MGGHGGLNILPQKRWNVYNFDNREKVRRDEAEAAREEQLQREAVRRRDSDLRLAALRRNRGLQSADAAPLPPRPPTYAAEQCPADPADPSPAADDSDGGHINLFSARGGGGGSGSLPRTLTLRSGRGRRRRAVGPDEEKYRLGYGLAGKGVAAPWYMSKPSASSSMERKDREAGEGSVGKKNGGKKSIEELREERRKREAKEKERERALLGVPSRKEKYSERGRSSRYLYSAETIGDDLMKEIPEVLYGKKSQGAKLFRRHCRRGHPIYQKIAWWTDSTLKHL
uniref:CBF1-interacting co-repressor CIR N-terminal domain-containing protein n=1 Tax=Oryza barthii TaxID=65489 RepID=A0A0D3HFG3_9ORYZ